MNQGDAYKAIFEEIYEKLKIEFDNDEENPVILYYLCLASLLTKKITHCKQTTKLFKTLYSLNEKDKGKSNLVVHYYLAKSKNIEKLLQKLPKTI